MVAGAEVPGVVLLNAMRSITSVTSLPVLLTYVKRWRWWSLRRTHLFDDQGLKINRKRHSPFFLSMVLRLVAVREVVVEIAPKYVACRSEDHWQRHDESPED